MRTEMGIEEAFELGEDTLNLPALAEATFWEASVHLASVPGLGWFGATAGVDGEDGEANTEFASADGVEVLGIVRGIAQK
jgi:hypothetical protein